MDFEPSSFHQFFAQTIGSPSTSPFLIELFRSAQEGHLYLHTDKAPPLPAHILSEGKTLLPTTPIVRKGSRYYLQKNWVYATHIAEQMERLRQTKASGYDRHRFCEALHAIESKLLPEQYRAIEQAFDHPLTLICGGPGTGKTYTAGHLARTFAAAFCPPTPREYRIALAAPTGKAALHLQSILLAQGDLPCESTTLHRLLNLRPHQTKLFSGRRIDADLVIVDEGSMIGASLLAHLLEAIGDETHLVLLGDPNQLPPINEAAVFPEIARSHGHFLQRSMRIEELSLQKIADGILAARFEDVPEPLPIEMERICEHVEGIVSDQRPDPTQCLALYHKKRILNALRKGPFGSEVFNQYIFKKLDQRCLSGQWWSVPILLMAASEGLSNGASGVLIGQKRGREIDLSLGQAFFLEGQCVREMDLKASYEMAFCLSIHKSQGSEFEEVFVVLPKGSERFDRSMLYTAATRAKKRLTLYSTPETVQSILYTNPCFDATHTAGTIVAKPMIVPS